MKKVILSLACVAALALSSCSIVSTGAGSGAIYTAVTEGVTATSNNLGSKVGTANATGVLGLVAVGDDSIQKAAKSAGITKISHIDAHKMSVLGLFAQYTLYVYGE